MNRMRYIMPPAAMILASALLYACGPAQPRYIETTRMTRGERGTIGRNWNTMAGTQLANLGHDYQATKRQAYANVKRTLARFGLRIRHQQASWGYIDKTYPSKGPRAVTQALLNKYNRKQIGVPARDVRYTVEVKVTDQQTQQITNVNFIVYPEVLTNVGMSTLTWLPIPSDGSIRKALFKDLDTRMPVYKLKGDVRWRRW